MVYTCMKHYPMYNNITVFTFYMIDLYNILSLFFQNETTSTKDNVMYHTPTSVYDLNITPHRLINSSNRQFVSPPRNILVTPSEYPFVTPTRFTVSANNSFVTLALFADSEDHSFQTPPKLAASTNYSFATPSRSRDTDDHLLVTLKVFTDSLDESYLSPPRYTDFADNSFVNQDLTRESDSHSLRTSPTFIHTVFVTPRKSRRAILSDSMITPLRATNHVRHSALTPSPSLVSISYSRPARRRRLSFSNSEISPARTDVSVKRPSSVKDMEDEKHVSRSRRNKTKKHYERRVSRAIKNKRYFSDIQVSEIRTLYHIIISFVVY